MGISVVDEVDGLFVEVHTAIAFNTGLLRFRAMNIKVEPVGITRTYRFRSVNNTSKPNESHMLFSFVF